MRLLAVIGAALTLVPAAAGTSATGLFGVVRRSPITPVCVAERPCSAPARGTTLVFSGARGIERKVVTTKTGAYRIALPAGSYSVRLDPEVSLRRIVPAAVRVPRGLFTRINFTIDTGIR